MLLLSRRSSAPHWIPGSGRPDRSWLAAGIRARRLAPAPPARGCPRGRWVRSRGSMVPSPYLISGQVLEINWSSCPHYLLGVFEATCSVLRVGATQWITE